VAAHNGQHDRPVGELMSELAEQTSTLVRQELALARAELMEKGRTAGIGAGLIGGGGGLALFAFGALTVALILLLDEAMPPGSQRWWSRRSTPPSRPCLRCGARNASQRAHRLYPSRPSKP
jgi:hypothetical protein